MEERVKGPLKLSGRRLELLADLLTQQGIGQAALHTIPVRPNQQEFPLSSNQRRLWLLSKLEDGIHYNDHFDLRLKGRLHVVALERAIEEILNRHESTR